MKEKKVKEVMIPLSDYATISEDETLGNAIKELKEAQKATKYTRKHRAVLAFDENDNITGKVSIRCIFKALEPKYGQFGHPENINTMGLSRFGFSDKFLGSLLENHSLWDETLDQLVKKGAKQKVKDVMSKPMPGEFVSEDATVAEAVHHFILGCHQSLLVVKEDLVTGIVRMVDLFDLVSELVE